MNNQPNQEFEEDYFTTTHNIEVRLKSPFQSYVMNMAKFFLVGHLKLLHSPIWECWSAYHHFDTCDFGKSHLGTCTIQPCGCSGRWTFQNGNVLTWGLFGMRNFQHKEFLAQEHFGTGTFRHMDISAQLHMCRNICAEMYILLCKVPKYLCAEMFRCWNIPVPKCSCAENSSCRKFLVPKIPRAKNSQCRKFPMSKRFHVETSIYWNVRSAERCMCRNVPEMIPRWNICAELVCRHSEYTNWEMFGLST